MWEGKCEITPNSSWAAAPPQTLCPLQLLTLFYIKFIVLFSSCPRCHHPLIKNLVFVLFAQLKMWVEKYEITELRWPTQPRWEHRSPKPHDLHLMRNEWRKSPDPAVLAPSFPLQTTSSYPSFHPSSLPGPQLHILDYNSFMQEPKKTLRAQRLKH